MTLPTPLYNLNSYPDVYEPSEDTHLFLDALEQDKDYLIARRPTLACEVGSGSGILITALASILQSSCAYFSTDINLSACNATRTTSIMNKFHVEPVRMNLTSMFNRCKFDIVLFNPPYVVTDVSEIVGNGLERAYAGGKDGREIIDSFVNKLPDVLSDKGVCYLLLLRENKIDELRGLLKKMGFISTLVVQRKIPGEHLFVYKIER